MSYPAIDPLKLRVLPLSQRRNLLSLVEETGKAAKASPPADAAVREKIEQLAEKCSPPGSARRRSC